MEWSGGRDREVLRGVRRDDVKLKTNKMVLRGGGQK